MTKPLYKTLRLYSKGKIETFRNVWNIRFICDFKGIEVKHGEHYGLFTHSTRPLDQVYQITK